MNVSAVILAGGKSSRMGQDKAFLEFDGQTLLARAVALAHSLRVEEVVISGRLGQDYRGYGCRVLHDLEADNGPLSGIERALWHAGSELVLVLAVDLARMTRSCLRPLLARCEPLTGAVGRVRGRLEPLAAFYPVRSHVIASERLRNCQLSAGGFAGSCLREGMVREVRVPESYARCFANWNTRLDLDRSCAFR